MKRQTAAMLWQVFFTATVVLALCITQITHEQALASLKADAIQHQSTTYAEAPRFDERGAVQPLVLAQAQAQAATNRISAPVSAANLPAATALDSGAHSGAQISIVMGILFILLVQLLRRIHL